MWGYAPLDNYLGVLPVRNKEGIHFPVGKWTEWYFSEELKYAITCGYKINVLKGYTFNRVHNVFSTYIDKIYNIKSNPINKTQKSMAKSLLNNLLGRFGINLDRGLTKVVSRKKFDQISVMNKISAYKIIDDDRILVSYIPKLDYYIITSPGLNFIRIFNN